MSGEDGVNVPPARQCTFPTCSREAVDSDHSAELCERHLAELEGNDGDQDETQNSSGPTAGHSGEIFVPDALEEREWWVDWVLALPLDDNGTPETDAVPTKQPIAPYQRGDASPVQWNFGLADDEHPSTDYETVTRWAGTRIGLDLHARARA